MAVSSWGVNHPLAVKTWASKLFVDAIGATYWGKFTGTTSSAMVHVKNEVSKGPGDRITIGLRALPTGSGIQGDDTLEGNEEALTTYSVNVLIDQLRHAFRSGGRMSEQRVPFSVREELRAAAQDWWAERLDISLANQLTGNTAQSDTRYTGNQATTAPSSANSVTRILFGNGEGGEGSLSATVTHIINLKMLDRAKALAHTQSPRIRPIRIDGSEYHVAFLHPYSIYHLRQFDTQSTGMGFTDVFKTVMQGGKISDNPILNGANFIYNNIAVHEWTYLPTIVGTPNSGAVANFRRGVFCGAQAAVVAFGQDNGPTKMTWVEERFDYQNQLGVAAGMIFGIKKPVYNSIDYATIVLAGYAPTP